MASKLAGMVQSSGKLYVMRFILPEKTVYKIGMTNHSRPTDRLMEIVRSYYEKYRETPIAKILRYRSCDNVFAVEAALHRYFGDYRSEFDKQFDGCTECFDIPEEIALQVYDEAREQKVDYGSMDKYINNDDSSNERTV